MQRKNDLEKRIYLDYSATTPPDPRVIEAMTGFMQKNFGNPSSIHSFGQDVREFLDKARDGIREYIGADEPTEITFTSGGTESDNMAIMGIVKASKIQKPHVITTLIEHKAVLDMVKYLEKNEWCDATYLKVDQNGEIDLAELQRAIRYNTILVSIMYANNEVGTIQPIREVGKYLEKLNGERSKAGFPKIYLHTDAVQAFPYLNVDVKHLHVDLMSVSGHKFYGPKGVGFLYIKKGTLIERITHGGGQEFGKRAGTENTYGIAGLYKAIELLKKEKEKDSERVAKLRDELVKEISKIPNVILTGHKKKRLPCTASFIFKNIEGESIAINLDLEGVAVSTGSACTSGSLSPSHVLTACGYDHADAQGNIRMSLGKYTTKEEIKRTVEILKPIVERLREMSPLG